MIIKRSKKKYPKRNQKLKKKTQKKCNLFIKYVTKANPENAKENTYAKRLSFLQKNNYKK